MDGDDLRETAAGRDDRDVREDVFNGPIICRYILPGFEYHLMIKCVQSSSDALLVSNE